MLLSLYISGFPSTTLYILTSTTFSFPANYFLRFYISVILALIYSRRSPFCLSMIMRASSLFWSLFISTRDWSFSSVIFESESAISALSEEYLFSESIRLDFNMRMSLAF